jgi:PAS domain S-box-containing protein
MLDAAIKASLPGLMAPPEAVVCTEELRRRWSRPPDYEKENRALTKLAGELAARPSNILQKLAETILDVAQCDSSGVRLLTKDDGGKSFYWTAVAGVWGSHVYRVMPRDFRPALAEECLLAPVCVQGRAVGTVWATVHDNRRKFDAEDERLMKALGHFASLAYQTLRTIEDFKLEIAARDKAEARMRELIDGLETKVRRLVASNIIGAFIWDLDGGIIIDVNQAFLRITGHDRDDLVSGRSSWRELTPIEWRDVDDQRLDVVKTSGIVEPYVKEFVRKDGSRVRVLVGASILDGARNEGVAFVVDLTDLERTEEAARESERRYQQTQLALVHANRVATMGQLSASIAHEVNQPIAATVTNAHTALRWLEAQPPNLEKVKQTLGRIVSDGNRAGDVVGRIRAFVKKESPRRDRLEINQIILEVIELTRGEAIDSNVSIRTEFAAGLAPIEGDRIQLQQVMLNLIINAIEAMRARGDGSRELRIATGETESGGVVVAVQDSGLGVNPSDLERIFDAFYSTKPDGLGIGLSVCRAIVEAHGGKLWASAGGRQGTIFQFTLPAGAEGAYAR